MKKLFGNKRFDVESSLNMHATSFIVLPAFAIYEEDIIGAYKAQIQHCHIYLIGLVPKIDLVDCIQDGLDLVTSCQLAGHQYDLRWPMPPGLSLKGDCESGWYVIDAAGTKSFPNLDVLMARLNAETHIDFKVLYIGQAFGENGSRNALDRLRKHETLQKIAVKGTPQEYVLTLLLLEIILYPRILMMFNPFAKDASQGRNRINKGLNKLANTTEAEKTTLYEASLIRYFAPPYNKEFKDSFPSTNMKLLADFYDKDIAAVTAEVVFDNLPFRLYSDTVAARDWHMAHHDLHKEEDRKVFFLGAPSTKDR
jgi:hypothetical protein